MTPEKARELTNSAEPSNDVIRIIERIKNEIEASAKLRKNYADLTRFIPSYGSNERTAWFIAMDEIRKSGFEVRSNYMGKAYSINGNAYSYYVKW